MMNTWGKTDPCSSFSSFQIKTVISKISERGNGLPASTSKDYFIWKQNLKAECMSNSSPHSTTVCAHSYSALFSFRSVFTDFLCSLSDPLTVPLHPDWTSVWGLYNIATYQHILWWMSIMLWSQWIWHKEITMWLQCKTFSFTSWVFTKVLH